MVRQPGPLPQTSPTVDGFFIYNIWWFFNLSTWNRPPAQPTDKHNTEVHGVGSPPRSSLGKKRWVSRYAGQFFFQPRGFFFLVLILYPFAPYTPVSGLAGPGRSAITPFRSDAPPGPPTGYLSGAAQASMALPATLPSYQFETGHRKIRLRAPIH